MREHQININLKAQQFELLQRLAREKGYKSVSAYVREKILELALSMEPPSRSAGAAANPIEPRVYKELARIHGDLKLLIEESLGGADGQASRNSTNSVDAFSLVAGLDENNLLKPAGAGGAGFVAVGGTTGASGQSTGAESGVPFDIKSLANDLEQISSNDNVSDPLFGASSQTLSDNSLDVYENQAIPRGNLGGFGFGLSGYSSFLGGGYASYRGGISGGDRLAGYRDILDDLEELADRAFAISPRLGSVEEETPASETVDQGPLSVVPPVDVNALSTDIGSDDPEQSAQSASILSADVDISEPLMVVPPVDVSKLSVEEPQRSAEASPAAVPGQSSTGGRRPRPGRAIPAIEDASLVEALRSDGGSSTAAGVPQAVPQPAAEQASEPVLEQASEPGGEQASEPVPQPSSQDAPLEPSPADMASIDDYSVPSAEALPPPLVDVEEEDELLSELLDSDLIAQTQAPREDNPFAIGFAFEVSLETLPSSAQDHGGSQGAGMEQDSIEDSSLEGLEGLEEGSGVTEQPLAPQTDPQTTVSSSAAGSAALSGSQAQTLSGTLSGTTFPSAQVAQPAESGGSGQARDRTSSDQTGQIEDQSASQTGNQDNGPETSGGVARGQVAGGESQESSGMGVSGFSGGPPPKRRRT
ncbi:MAG: hypothetical protein SFV17_08665 [Candidatus Obscuribacter sp.]|nr:hypothetical protein [Candidatus Obscuribacter sp.]